MKFRRGRSGIFSKDIVSKARIPTVESSGRRRWREGSKGIRDLALKRLSYVGKPNDHWRDVAIKSV